MSSGGKSGPGLTRRSEGSTQADVSNDKYPALQEGGGGVTLDSILGFYNQSNHLLSTVVFFLHNI